MYKIIRAPSLEELERLTSEFIALNQGYILLGTPIQYITEQYYNSSNHNVNVYGFYQTLTSAISIEQIRRRISQMQEESQSDNVRPEQAEQVDTSHPDWRAWSDHLEGAGYRLQFSNLSDGVFLRVERPFFEPLNGRLTSISGIDQADCVYTYLRLLISGFPLEDGLVESEALHNLRLSSMQSPTRTAEVNQLFIDFLATTQSGFSGITGLSGSTGRPGPSNNVGSLPVPEEEEI